MLSSTRVILIAICLFSTTTCFAGKYIYIAPVKAEDQKEFLVQGGVILQSDKQFGVEMYQTSAAFKYRKGNFHFSVMNRSEEPVNLYFQNLSATDQWGRPLRIVPKAELIRNKHSQASGALFLSALCTGLDCMNAQDAGTMHYSETEYSRYNVNSSARSSRGYYNAREQGSAVTTTHGTIHNEALRQQAMRQVAIDSQYRENKIEQERDSWEYAINSYYFDSNTIYPGDVYGANFQIDIPSCLENDLSYIFVNVDVSGERHTFCFYCAKER